MLQTDLTRSGPARRWRLPLHQSLAGEVPQCSALAITNVGLAGRIHIQDRPTKKAQPTGFESSLHGDLGLFE